MRVDPRALQEHAEFLRRLARGMLYDRSAAEDLAQETLSIALQAKSAPRGDLRGWLVGVARNLMRNRHRADSRRRRRERAAAQPGSEPPTDESVSRAEVQKLIADAVARLPEPGRSMVLSRYFDGETATTIARRHGVTAKTVREHLRKSLARLRAVLDRAFDRKAWMGVLAAIGLQNRTRAAVLASAAGTVFVGILLIAGVGAVAYLAWPEGDKPVERIAVSRVPDAPRSSQGPPAVPRRADPPAATDRKEPPPPASENGRPPDRPDSVSAQPPSGSRPEPKAGVSNDPQTPLPKHGSVPEWHPDQLWFSHSGRHFCAVWRRGQHRRDLAFDYQLFERRPGAPRPPEVPFASQPHKRDDARYLALKRVWLNERSGKLIGKGTVHQLPQLIHVLDREPGVVLFERFSHYGHGNSLSYIDREGRLRWTLTLADLFDAEERAQFKDVDNSLHWNKGWLSFWVDEEQRTALVQSVKGTFIEVDLDTGVPRRTRASALLSIIRQPGYAHARIRAIKAAAPEHPRRMGEVVRDIYRNEKEPLAVRLHAAAVALYDGGPNPPAELFRLGLEVEELKPFARRHLAELEKGTGLVKVLAQLAGPTEGLRAARDELTRRWGRIALPGLRRIAGDPNQPAVVRLRALHVHHVVAPKVPLREVVADSEIPGLLIGGFQFWRVDNRLEAWCEQEIVAYGDRAAVHLVGLVNDERADLQARREAAETLARIRTEKTFDSLVALLAHQDNIIVWHAQSGLNSRPAKELDRRFKELLRDGSPADLFIAEHYRTHPNAAMLEPLLRAMERCPDDPKKRMAFGRAVARCSGEWIAETADPAAWRGHLGR
ncbi:MAG: sigma-70 family RNA polymerase sigma factor [Planctomycetota bacterium]|jgi:RNA polymerase sigma-70 factor (ECF subfamily)